MKNVAAFYAGKAPSPGFAKNKDTVVLGEKIYRGGIADRAMPGLRRLPQPPAAPACPAQYPRLGGQHADYTEAQLVAFRDGARANNAQMTGRRRQDERPRDQGRATTSPACAEPASIAPKRPVPHRLFSCACAPEPDACAAMRRLFDRPFAADPTP
jgi:hypothetical protein